MCGFLVQQSEIVRRGSQCKRILDVNSLMYRTTGQLYGELLSLVIHAYMSSSAAASPKSFVSLSIVLPLPLPFPLPDPLDPFNDK